MCFDAIESARRHTETKTMPKSKCMPGMAAKDFNGWRQYEHEENGDE
jgi:hypothetical protein